ncbi:MAG: YqeG family HAD IIIA-type phosphatase [Clostridia bacterium]|nr:YqeG family HAD IIIA-type phosphatase [Clostridia bacterium]
MAIFKPGFFIDSVLAISPEMLKKSNIKSILIDIDDTLTAHGSPIIEQDILNWIHLITSSGIKIILVSNNFKNRVQKFAKKVSLPFVYFSCKPLPIGFFWALKKTKTKKNEAVIVGDQIFTDVLGANLFGMKSILVEPRSKSKTISLKIKRFIERPIKKHIKKTHFCGGDELK